MNMHFFGEIGEHFLAVLVTACSAYGTISIRLKFTGRQAKLLLSSAVKLRDFVGLELIIYSTSVQIDPTKKIISVLIVKGKKKASGISVVLFTIPDKAAPCWICNNDSAGIGKFCRYGILWNEKKNVFTADWPVTFLIITEINYPSWYF